MTPLLKTLSRLFGSSEKKETKAEAASISNKAESPPADEKPAMTPPKEPETSFSEPPAVRRVVQAPDITPGSAKAQETDKIVIKAEPSANGDQCKFMVNRDLFPGLSWFFPTFESAANSPLAESLFSNDKVESVLVHNSTLVVTKYGSKSMSDWETLARDLGRAIRETLENHSTLFAQEILSSIPPEAKVREEIQKVIDTEVNPGVAGHGGRITLTKVDGNAVTIEMGGGCQGCSAADMTLKQGIHNSFRKAVPYIGAIYDETDHAAGMNPYFS